MESFSLIYITAPNKKEARKISQILVEEKLAACVNIFPIESIYRWRGKVQKEKEFGMIVKTRKKLVEKAVKMIKRLHSYQIPCIISVGIEKGYQKFLKWIEEATK